MGNLEISEQWEQVEMSSVGEWGRYGVTLQREEICDSVLQRKEVFRQREPVGSFINWFPTVIYLH